jgi:hypothetical protein
MRIVDTTVASYDMGDGFFILVNYYTNNIFDITCSNRMTEVLCCIMDVITDMTVNCNNNRGINAREKYDSVAPYLAVGLFKEVLRLVAKHKEKVSSLIDKFISYKAFDTTTKGTIAYGINTKSVLLTGESG